MSKFSSNQLGNRTVLSVVKVPYARSTPMTTMTAIAMACDKAQSGLLPCYIWPQAGTNCILHLVVFHCTTHDSQPSQPIQAADPNTNPDSHHLSPTQNPCQGPRTRDKREVISSSVELRFRCVAVQKGLRLGGPIGSLIPP